MKKPKYNTSTKKKDKLVYNGISFDSKDEMLYYQFLESEVENKRIARFDHQVKMDENTKYEIVGRCIKNNKWEPVDENIEKQLIGKFEIPKGYEALAREMQSAIDQAATGKGKERHATDEPFENQKICQITRWISGSPVAGVLFQAIKKTIESSRLDTEAAIRELDGAKNYLCAATLLLGERIEDEKTN